MAETLSTSGTAPPEHPRLHRPVALLVLLVAGVVSLPVAATFLDGEGTENLILPAAVLGTAIVGAVVGSVLPGLAGEHATRSRGRWVGSLVGVVMTLIGVLVFFLLLSGLDGA